MRYQLCKPSLPVDPRYLGLASLDAFLAIAVPVVDCELESEAVTSVRLVLPDAVAMPVPVKIGSGTVWMLGFVEDSHAHYTAESTIPFVLFVRAVPERESDRTAMRKHSVFDRKKWKMPVHRPQPDGMSVHEVEVRASDLEDAVACEATVGRLKDGRLVICVDVGGIAMSLAFADPDLELGELDATSEGPDRMKRVLEGPGSNFDPNPW